jgi:hypothetical protein
LYTPSSRQPQRKKSGDNKSGDWGATGSFKGLSCSEAKTHTVKMCATQCHLLRLQHITHAQFWHEQAMLLKQVPSASDNFFKNYRQKQMGILYESSCTRGNNIGSVFEATWSKISITYFILTVYSLLTCSHNFFWMSLIFLYQFLKNDKANLFVLRIYHPSIWQTNKTLHEIRHFHNSEFNLRSAQRHNPEDHNIKLNSVSTHSFHNQKQTLSPHWWVLLSHDQYTQTYQCWHLLHKNISYIICLYISCTDSNLATFDDAFSTTQATYSQVAGWKQMVTWKYCGRWHNLFKGQRTKVSNK